MGLAAMLSSQPAAYGQAAPAAAQQPAAQGPQWKDRGEYDLFVAITQDRNATTRLAKLDEWKQKYAQTDFLPQRRQLYLVTYQELNKPDEFFTTADEILAADPNNLQALTTLVTYIYRVPNATPQQLATTHKGATQLISNIDALFAADKKPEAVKQADWDNSKKEIHLLAQNTLGQVAVLKKEPEVAEAEFEKSLKMNPNQGSISYSMASAILAQMSKIPDQKKKVETLGKALFHLARATNYDGPNSLPADQRAKIKPYFERQYVNYRGNTTEMDKLIAAAKENALPPPGFVYPKDKLTEFSENEAARKEFAKKYPDKALWKTIKEALMADNGQAYFDKDVKGAGLPGGAPAPDTDPPVPVTKFKGTLVSADPETNPKELKLAIDGTDPEVTLKLDAPLRGKLDPNIEIGFEGSPEAFTKEPFNLTFAVEKANLTGLPATATGGAAAKKAAPVRRPVPKKK